MPACVTAMLALVFVAGVGVKPMGNVLLALTAVSVAFPWGIASTGRAQCKREH